MDVNSKIFVAGHNGLVGSAIIRKLESQNYENIYWVRKKNCDLKNRGLVDAYFKQAQPEYVFLAAAKVGGIHANSTYPADFIYDNLMIQTNVIDAAYRHGVKKLLFLGSSCIYPKFADQPITEDALLTSSLEPTNEMYAVAKIAGIKMCQAYRDQYGFNAISVMPTNLYGPGDNFDLQTSHVLPAMMAKFHGSLEKSEHWRVKLWGDGSPKREFLHVDDLADACLFLMHWYNESEHINVGTGEDISIKDLAELIAEVVGYKNDVDWDSSKPNGTPRKLLDVSKINNLGWESKIGLREGIQDTYNWYRQNLT
jgi:GDP-L-fucose synthase